MTPIGPRIARVNNSRPRTPVSAAAATSSSPPGGNNGYEPLRDRGGAAARDQKDHQRCGPRGDRRVLPPRQVREEDDGELEVLPHRSVQIPQAQAAAGGERRPERPPQSLAGDEPERDRRHGGRDRDDGVEPEKQEQRQQRAR